MNVEKDDAVTVPRLLRFQATALGYSLLLVLPIFGVLAFVSSLDITGWGDGSPTAATTPPVVNEELFFTAVFTLMAIGLVTALTTMPATHDPTFLPRAGPKVALWVYLPVMTISTTAVLLLFLGVPAWLGTDVHFNHLDVAGFVVCAIVSIVGASVVEAKLSPLVQPKVYQRIAAAKKTQNGDNANTEDQASNNLVADVIFSISLISVVVACK